MLSILVCFGGLVLIVFSKTLALIMYKKTQMPVQGLFSEFGLPSIKSKKVENFLVKINRWGLIFAGVILVLISYSMIFGPISL